MPLEKFAEYLLSLLEESKETEPRTQTADDSSTDSSDGRVA